MHVTPLLVFQLSALCTLAIVLISCIFTQQNCLPCDVYAGQCWRWLSRVYADSADYAVYLMEFQALLGSPAAPQAARLRLDPMCTIAVELYSVSTPVNSSMELVELCSCHRKPVLTPSDLLAPTGMSP
jgi:hypothetical protein